MDSRETLKDDLLKGELAIFPPRQNRGWDGGVYTLFLHLHRACEPSTRKRVLSPFSTGLGDSSSSSPSRGTQGFVLPATAVTKRNGLVPGKREVFCPSLKGKGDRPNGRWMGSYTDRLRNTIFKIQRGVRTLYPLKRALSPFSTGLGDSSSSSPSRGTQSFVLP